MKTIFFLSVFAWLFAMMLMPESDITLKLLCAVISIVSAVSYESLVIQEKIDENKKNK